MTTFRIQLGDGWCEKEEFIEQTEQLSQKTKFGVYDYESDRRDTCRLMDQMWFICAMLHKTAATPID